MLFKTHFMFAVFIYLLIFNFVDEKIWFFAFLILGTVVVDLDSRKSFIGKFFIFRPLQILTKHRGMMHSLFFGLVLGFFVWVGFNGLVGAFLLGYFLHLFLDVLTFQGVVLFWPLSDRKISFGVKSGGIFETIFFVLLIIGCFIVVGYRFHNVLYNLFFTT